MDKAQKGLLVLAEEDEDFSRRPFDQKILGRLLIYLRPYRRQVVFMVGAALAAVGAALLLPYLLKIGIDRYMAQNDFRGLSYIALLYIGVGFLHSISLRAQQRLMYKIGQKALFDLRQDLFSHLQYLSLNFYDREKAGRIMIRVTNDVNSLEEVVTSGVSTALADSIILMGLLGMMIWLDWRMSLVVFLTLPPTIWAAVFLRNRMLAVSREIRRKLSAVNANLNESLMGIRVTQAFGREETNASMFRGINEEHYEAGMRFVPINAFFWPWVGFLNTVGTTSVIAAGGVLFQLGWVTPGVIAAFLSYINRFFQPIQNLSNLFNVITTAMAGCERIFTLMDLRPEVKEPVKPLPLGAIRGEVSFREVDFSYNGAREKPVLKGFNLEVKPGEVVALVGPTGAGKTTVINLLARFYDPTAGEVLVDGCNLRNLSSAEYRSQIAVVLQDTFIFSGTIADNIRYGYSEAGEAEVVAAARAVGIHDFIIALPEQYQTIVRERGGSLSMGQRQLIALARAIIRNPRIIILDEATANIDTKSEMALQEALKRILPGRTAFIIAHRLSTIKSADRIIVIEDGRLTESGNHHELIRQSGRYAALYEKQYRAV